MNWTPPNLNDGIGRHWSRARSIKKTAANVLGIYAATVGVRRVREDYLPRRRVTIRARGWKSGTLPDPDNLLKFTLDALKLAYLIVDDSSEWLECPMPVVTRAASGEPTVTTVLIEDIE